MGGWCICCALGVRIHLAKILWVDCALACLTAEGPCLDRLS